MDIEVEGRNGGVRAYASSRTVTLSDTPTAFHSLEPANARLKLYVAQILVERSHGMVWRGLIPYLRAIKLLV